MKRFKILKAYGVPPCRVQDVPWSFVENYEEQAWNNHMQTLDRLNERGGLSPRELYSLKHNIDPLKCKKSEIDCINWLEELFL